jgi:hypothetical protein
MRNVIIDFLNEAEHSPGTHYEAAKHFTKILAPYIYRCVNEQEVHDLIATLNTDVESLTITFLSHGGETGLGMWENGVHHELMFNDLLKTIEACVTKHDLYLNLMANCLSFGIENIWPKESKIAEIWVTRIKEPTARTALMAADEESFESISHYLNSSERKQYDCLKH